MGLAFGWGQELWGGAGQGRERSHSCCGAAPPCGSTQAPRRPACPARRAELAAVLTPSPAPAPPSLCAPGPRQLHDAAGEVRGLPQAHPGGRGAWGVWVRGGGGAGGKAITLESGAAQRSTVYNGSVWVLSLSTAGVPAIASSPTPHLPLTPGSLAPPPCPPACPQDSIVQNSAAKAAA